MTWTEITEELLGADPISGLEGWESQSELKKEVQTFVREELQHFNDKVLWINIVALLIPEDPRKHVLYPAPAYNEAVKSALFLPVAVDSTKQNSLDEAYKRINQAERLEESEKHLSYHVIKLQKEAHKNYLKFQYMPDNKIEISSCSCKRSSAIKFIVNGYDHYEDLFKLMPNNNTIWFLPHHIYHLPGAKPDLYKTHMAGVYLGTEDHDPCKIEEKNSRLKEILYHLIEMFYIKRRHDQDNEFYENYIKIADENKRRIMMIDNLQKPLEDFAQSLSSIWNSSQTIISIVHCSSRALFNVSPQVRKYFVNNNKCKFGMVEWTGVHEADVNKSEINRSVAATMCAVVCHIFSKLDENIQDEHRLFNLTETLLKAEDDENNLRSTLRLILTGKSDNGSDGLTIFLKHIKNAILSTNSTNNKIIAGAFLRMKSIIHAPYKFSGKAPLTPLALLFYVYGYTGEIEYYENDVHEKLYIKQIFSKAKFIEYFIFNPKSLPVPRYIDLLLFFDGILSYMLQHPSPVEIEKVKITVKKDDDEIAFGEVRLTFSKDNFYQLDNISDLFRLMDVAVKEGLYGPQGNFRKPFIDFAFSVSQYKKLNLEQEKINSSNVVGENNHIWTVKKDDWQTSLSISAKSIALNINKNKEAP